MWFRQVLRLQSISRRNFQVQVKYEIHLCPVLSATKPARSRKNGYYEVLGISANSRAGDIKTGYLNIVKKHHPDRAGQENEESKAIFEEATEAYQCLMDPTQRYFYDRHGFPPDTRNQRSSSTYDYQPKYNVYRKPDEQQTQKQYEEWIKSQGHSGADEKSYKQRLKNMYVELRYGFKYYDMPWKIKEFFQILLGVSVTIVVICYGFVNYIRWMMETTGKDKNPPRLNDMSRNPEIALQNDILGHAGARKYSNSPFNSEKSKHAKNEQEFFRSSSHGDEVEVQKAGKRPKHLYWVENPKELPEENTEKLVKESRKERRQRIQKELHDGKIAHRISVLRDRLKLLDSEALIVRNEIRSLESKRSTPDES